MKTNKDVLAFLEGEDGFPMKDFGDTFLECSKNETTKIPIVTSEERCYNYDKIVKAIFTTPPASADSLRITDRWIDFIEFKGGFVTKKAGKYEPIETECDTCKELHLEKYEWFKRFREINSEQIKDHLKVKAVESLCIFQNYILPRCRDTMPGTEYGLRFICVVERDSSTISSADKTILGMQDLAGHKARATPDGFSFLQRYETGIAENQKEKPFYENVKIIFTDEFENMISHKK